jgi:sugar/nucleoside kinase (ribokinase family)
MKTLDVAIAGELNLDLILYGLPTELPLEREVLASGFNVTLGSSSAILAHNLSALGVKVSFAGLTGTDDFGRAALAYLEEAGVDTRQVRAVTDGTRTGVTVLLTHDSGRRILTYPGPMSSLKVKDLDIDQLAKARHFHLSSLFLQTGLHQGLVSLVSELKRRGSTISLDTNDDPSGEWNGVLHELLPLVDVLLPNRDELCRIARRDTVELALQELAPIVPLIAVKCGEEGAIVQERDVRTAVTSISVQAIDSIGAGDSFNTGFLAAWLSGLNAVESARVGNITGAWSTTQPGGIEAFRQTSDTSAFLAQHLMPKATVSITKGLLRCIN